MVPAYSDPDSEFIRFPHIERPFPFAERYAEAFSKAGWPQTTLGAGIMCPLHSCPDPLTRLKSHHSDIAAFLNVGMDRMTSFSTSTTRKKMMLPQTSQNHAASGKPSVLKISWNGGA